jgi:anaerobic selenocysteine-containing dehydrogenase
LFNALAVNALNALVGSVGQPGGLFFTPQIDLAPAGSGVSQPATSLRTLASGILGGGESPIQVLLVDGANPIFTAPRGWRVREAIEAVPYIASFGSFLDETSGMADLILPDHSFLESWVDAAPESGSMGASVSVAPAVMRPLYQTRAMPDVLLDVSRRLARPVDPPLPQTYEESLQTSLTPLPAAQPDLGDAWAAAQVQGYWSGTLPAGRQAPSMAPAPRGPITMTEPQFDGDAGQYPFHFLPYPSAAFLDGSLAHLPWLQEMPDPLTSAMWSQWVEINPTTAARLGIGDSDVVEVASAHGSVRAPAVITPGIAPDILAMPVGQGHQMFTRYASGRGENPVGVLAPVIEATTGALAWAATRVRVTRAGDPDGRLILFAGGLREHVEHER